MSRLDGLVRQFSARHRTARRIAPLTLSMAIYSGSCARANRKPWKPICWELGISRATANRRWRYGIAVIVWRMNGKQVPKKRSMEFVVRKSH